MAEWYNALPSDKKYLLAYVRAVQELSIGSNYFYYANGNSLIPQPSSKDPTGGPAGTMQLGYAAVCGSGGAGGPGCSGSPGDRLSVTQLDGVVASFCSFAAGVLLDAGLPRSRIMIHVGSPFGDPPKCEPPLQPCAFISPQAALVPNAQPGWSLYGGATNPGADAGLSAALSSIDGAPWGAPEWLAFFDRGRPASDWAAPLNATLLAHNNRLIVIQNFESIQGDPGPIAAVTAAVAAGPPCLVDVATLLSSARLNTTAFQLTWISPQAIGSAVSTTLLASTIAQTLPSGALAMPNIANVLLPVNTTSYILALDGFDGSEVFWLIVSRGCNDLQSAASDVGVVMTGR